MHEVRLERRDGIAIVTLDAPSRRNALTPSMSRELVATLDRVEADATVGVTVVDGGENFCAGADLDTLDYIAESPSEQARYQALDEIYASFSRLKRLGTATIAAVRGAAVGAGFNLALAADLLIVADDALLSPGFLRNRVHPGGGHFKMLLDAGGDQTAAAIGLFDQSISGEEAAEIGLAWKSTDTNEVMELALRLAARVAGDPELLRSAVKSFRTISSNPGVSWNTTIAVERAAQMWSLQRRP